VELRARPALLRQIGWSTWDNEAMRRMLIPLVAAGLIAGALAAQGDAAKKGPLSFKVRLIQEATFRHDNPPAGDAGDTFSTTLRLYAIGNVLGFPNNTPMGTMAFSWGPLNGSCSTTAAECSGTTNLETLTKLPGGTITANETNVNLGKGLIVSIQTGTGIFKGVKGTISIAPKAVAEDVFKLVMP
jgi:hypothetical protein